MLGVRRAGVTVPLHTLEQRGIIQLARKQMVILDREGLKKAANGTYHEPEML
jgi:Crp-like helix-turn-helix domain